MLPRVCILAVLVGLASAIAAQPSNLGDPFPLTATRYGVARGSDPRVVSNRREPVVFWTYGQTVRMSRLVNGRFTMSRVVGEGSYDVVWTGGSFVVVTTPLAAHVGGGVFAQTFDANGEPRGEAFRIAEHGGTPRVAFNGRNVLLLYSSFVVPTNNVGLHALLLTRDGRPVDAQPRDFSIPTDGPVALASNGDSFAALVPNVIEPSLLFFDASGRLQSKTVFHQYGAGVAIASDGRRYLGVAACAEGRLCMPAVSRVIEADGTVGAAVELDQPFHGDPSVVWNGAKWVVGYTRDFHLDDKATLQVVQLDAAARVVERRDARPAFEASLGVFGDGVLAAWTNARYHDVIHAGPVPFDAATSIPASYTAAEQSLVAAEASSQGTLVVWREANAVHAGFRDADGSWSERAVADDVANVLVAGTGEEFLLHLGADQVQRLDARGNPIGNPIALPFVPQRILSAGSDYVFVHGDRMIARMTPSGTIVANKQLPAVAGQPRVYAANSDGEVITARVDQTYVNHYPTTIGLSIVRLDRDFNAIDTTPILLAAGDQSLHPFIALGAGWDGRQWVVTWVSSSGVMAAQIAESGPANPKIIKLADGDALEFTIKAVPGGAAILRNVAWNTNDVTFLRYDGTATPPLVVSSDESDRGYESGAITLLPHGDLAYVESALRREAPFESTTRVTFRILANAPLPPTPSAPRLTIIGDVLSWEPPPQPVDGYRIEARIDDGPWTEIAPPLSRDTRTYAVTRTPGSRYVFRIRAWNEGGVGEWSTVWRRRRAVD
ncbi:MAG TPA: fibronectin type III domain-containing protein [Thermoanaerobaculia bacterium]|nr:fibronectin type III domain-containing protein [Thermoanaerobaculia bacterium]